MEAVRNSMAELGLAAYFLPNNDPHNSEYLADFDKRMPFLSGFNGSNGQILITATEALLWTDGRYWIAAEQQLYEGWSLMKMKQGEPTYFEWIVSNLPQGSIIGYDPKLIPAQAAKSRTEYFSSRGFEFRPIEKNLANEVWENRPSMPMYPAVVHELEYAGATVAEKIERIRNEMKEYKVSFVFTNLLDEIAWTLNLRGKDIEYNPVFMAYLLLELTEESYKANLFIYREKTEGIEQYLEENKVTIFSYDEVEGALAALEEPVLVDLSEINNHLFLEIKNPVQGKSVISYVKAVKTERELRGLRECHLRDAVALTRYFAWLRHELNLGEEVNEYEAGTQCDYFRSQEALNQGLSFENISSSGSNAAIIHYAATAEKNSKIQKDEVYLLDSGGEYLDGTVDTTRVYHFGDPTEWEKECYTRVLLGNLAIEQVVWPASSRLTGNHLEILAREYLWEIGKDFMHATGHGVGYYLNVHEGPHVLSFRSEVPFKEGMCVTDEPGYYEKDNFGIRIENLLLIEKHDEHEGFLKFENVTMVPYDKNLLLMRILPERERAYINAYHEKIWNALSPVLEERGETLALSWLREATIPIELRMVCK